MENSTTNNNAGVSSNERPFPSGHKNKRIKRSALKPPVLTIDLSLQERTSKKPVKLDNIQSLISAVLTGSPGPAFVRLDNSKSIDKVVVVLAESLNYHTFGHEDISDLTTELDVLDSTKMPFVSSEFSKLIPIMTPGSNRYLFSIAATLSSRTIQAKTKRALVEELSSQKICYSDLVLDFHTLSTNEYPIHPDIPGCTKESVSQYSSYLRTKDLGTKPRALALDCEMCDVASGIALTRISVTDEDDNIVFTEFVKPEEEIIDYKTQYSGVDAKSLENVTTTLQDIQQRILETVSSKDYLIGHSLNSDLKVLKISHPRIIDTAFCFDHAKGPPLKPSLKVLAEEFLQRSIQNSDDGHDPTEDCRACMNLVKLKLEKGKGHGKLISEESIFRMLSRTYKKYKVDDKKVPKSGMSINFGGNEFFNEQRVYVSSDEEAVDALLKNVDNHELFLIRLREEADLDANIKRLYQGLPTNSLVIICGGHGDQTRINELHALQRRISGPLPPEDHQELLALVAKARSSIALLKLKATSPSE
ncbi:hypothetical protein OGAPHI_000219 [Ogataea philodendri]|uniref:Exonuclease domain-containing protein n=1 Tax=Ogataea philodendri TaxID=1378263 RepID=A0A9P8PGI5_9ASCO|nr:uncharacterized protein OGAPHI_000219 [Ogataea philodendri]KAH3671516.1 hypothetical protein OGAPHI_000219 [Ogataea philodendri]